MPTQAWRHDWQVVRLLHDGAVIPVSSHRWMRVADTVAFLRDGVAILTSPYKPAYHYDVRMTPLRRSATSYRFCIHCNADTTNPAIAVHRVDCPRHTTHQGA